MFRHYFLCNYYQISLNKSRFIGWFPCRKRHTSGSNIAKIIFWQKYFLKLQRCYYKRERLKDFFCNNFGEDGIAFRPILALRASSLVGTHKGEFTSLANRSLGFGTIAKSPLGEPPQCVQCENIIHIIEGKSKHDNHNESHVHMNIMNSTFGLSRTDPN